MIKLNIKFAQKLRFLEFIRFGKNFVSLAFILALIFCCFVSKSEAQQDIKNSKIISKQDAAINKISQSIMFSDAELEEIDNAINISKNGAPEPEKIDEKSDNVQNNARSYIYLNSILYSSPKMWSVWLNGSKITSDKNSSINELYIEKITKEKAYILWSIGITKWKILSSQSIDTKVPKVNAKNLIEIRFILRPNQTYSLIDNGIIDGRPLR